LTSPIFKAPEWKIDAARTALAPAVTAGRKSSAEPAPPLAMTGKELTDLTASIRAVLKPALVPSASTLFIRSSPMPRLWFPSIHARASTSVCFVPP